MVEKDRSIIVKKTYLLKMLHPLYQKNLENQLSESQLLFLNLLINVLQDIKEVSLEKIANALPIPILFESRRKKIQRFLSLPILNIQEIWFPIIETWLSQNFPENQRIYLVIDRTKWQRELKGWSTEEGWFILQQFFIKPATKINSKTKPSIAFSTFIRGAFDCDLL